MWEVTYYKTSSGRVPVLDYIESQETERIAKIRNAFRLLREFGIGESQLDTRKIRGKKDKKLYELKISSSRIIYFITSEKKFVLVHGFTKKSNKTPKKELSTARKRMRDYFRR